MSTIDAFESTGHTITPSAALSPIAHGLGAVPNDIVYFIDCVTPEYGYAAGERVFVGSCTSGSGIGSFHTAAADATNVNVQFANYSSPFLISNRNSSPAGQGGGITPANWTFGFLAKVITP